MNLSIVSTLQAGRNVVSVTGEVDVHTAPELDVELTTAIDGGARRFIVDLSAVDFLDSTGLSVLVKALARIRADDGSLAVVAPAERIAKVFRLTGLDQSMPLYADLPAALAAGSA